ALYTAEICSDFSTFSLLAANDDSPAENCAAQTDSASELFACGLVPGETYYVQIDGFLGETGNFGLSINEADEANCIARIQLIHNSADLGLQSVDIRINGEFPNEAFNNLDFRVATPYVDVPAGVEMSVSINPANSIDDS